MEVRRSALRGSKIGAGRCTRLQGATYHQRRRSGGGEDWAIKLRLEWSNDTAGGTVLIDVEQITGAGTSPWYRSNSRRSRSDNTAAPPYDGLPLWS